MKHFEAPELELQKFSAEDIVTVSTFIDEGERDPNEFPIG